MDIEIIINASSFFEGCSESELKSIDQDESIKSYISEIEEKIKYIYKVPVNLNIDYSYEISSTKIHIDDENMEETKYIQGILEDVWDAQTFWVNRVA